MAAAAENHRERLQYYESKLCKLSIHNNTGTSNIVETPVCLNLNFCSILT